MDDLAALRLQLEWGADEALLDSPVDRLAPASPRALAPPSRLPPVAPPVLPAAAAPTAPTPPAAAAPDLATLHAALDASDNPLRATATHTVAPSGNPAAGLVFIGEAPGREDDRAGEAYSGAPGQALDAVLASAGLGRDALLLAFLVPWRPPGGRDPSPAELAACLPYLHRLLALTRPRRIVLLGQGPLRALTQLQALRPTRGRWTQAVVPGLSDPVAALPMLPPDQWRKSAINKENAWTDLLCLRQALGTD